MVFLNRPGFAGDSTQENYIPYPLLLTGNGCIEKTAISFKKDRHVFLSGAGSSDYYRTHKSESSPGRYARPRYACTFLIICEAGLSAAMAGL